MFDLFAHRKPQPYGCSVQFGLGDLDELEKACAVFIAEARKGKVLVQGAEQATTSTRDDFVMRRITITFAEKADK